MVSGGSIIAGVLEHQGVRTLFTLCGGHISPILVEAKRRGIRVIDVRDEAAAVFAADATARLTGIPGVAAVTAGPGVTNTLTAVKNAQLAQSPVVLLGGAAATLLKGRGALQDIEQLALLRAATKWSTGVARLRDLEPALLDAFGRATDGVPGPVFVECPVDLLYPEDTVRDWYEAGTGTSDAVGIGAMLRRWYVKRHLRRLFGGDGGTVRAVVPRSPHVDAVDVTRTRSFLDGAARPLLLIGSQAMLRPEAAGQVALAVERLRIPTYLSGMARGLLPPGSPSLMRHGRRRALKDADLVILAGVPLDFRLEYGGHIGKRAALVTVNRSATEGRKNRRPDLAVVGDPSLFLERLGTSGGERWESWLGQLKARDRSRDEDIRSQSMATGARVNPLYLLQCVDSLVTDRSVLIMDGGDFVATASYTVMPRRPLSFLDPGVFGTLGVGGGFALGVAASRPDAEIWILYGDGSAAYSVAEFDTFVRHGMSVIAVVGNDGSWAQIARGQIEMLGDDVGTVLRRTDYHRVAEGYGGVGIKVERPDQVMPALEKAQRIAGQGRPVLINALIDPSEFRAGSLSM